MTNNAISKYATENGINLYEAVSIASSIAIKNELDYIEILDSHHPKELFFSISTYTEDERFEESFDFEKIQTLLESEYKFLCVMSDTLSSDEYITKLDAIIQNQVIKLKSENVYTETHLSYCFYEDSIGYIFTYEKITGQKSDTYYFSYNDYIAKACHSDILEWGQSFAEKIESEHNDLLEYLISDKYFLLCTTKESRLKYYDKIIINRYPYLYAIMTNQNSFRKMPNFYLSYDKKSRSYYAETVYEHSKN